MKPRILQPGTFDGDYLAALVQLSYVRIPMRIKGIDIQVPLASINGVPLDEAIRTAKAEYDRATARHYQEEKYNEHSQ